jgi:hypothetical protein
MKLRAVVLMVCAAALVLALRGVSSAAQTTTINAAISGALTDDEILAIGLDFAGANGEADPDGIVALAATQEEAVDAAMPGDDMGDSTPSDLIVITGDFTGYAAKVPEGDSPPVGSVISLVIDATTGEVTDWSLSGVEPDTTALGTTVTLR